MTRGMIVAPQPEAVEAGAMVLKEGGNAIDAGIACAFVQGVVDPQMTGIAGFGSLQAYLPGLGVHKCIDFHGKSPRATRPDMWEDLIEGEARDGFGFILKGNVNDLGYQSITVPGSLKAYAEAHEAWGRMPWAEILAPAIAHAREGVVVRPHMYNWWTNNERFGRTSPEERLKLTETGRRVYFNGDGSLKRVGERLDNPDMTATLEQLAKVGPDDFYLGDIASRIVEDMDANGGLISAQDLAEYRTTHCEPLRGTYRGFNVATNQPPGGGVVLLEMLNILENFDVAGKGHNSAEYIKVVTEAMKRATSDKDAHVGDPAFVEVPVSRLTSKDYARELGAAIERGERGVVERMKEAVESKSTTQVCVADEEGNLFTMTHSLGMPSRGDYGGAGVHVQRVHGGVRPSARPGGESSAGQEPLFVDVPINSLPQRGAVRGDRGAGRHTDHDGGIAGLDERAGLRDVDVRRGVGGTVLGDEQSHRREQPDTEVRDQRARGAGVRGGALACVLRPLRGCTGFGLTMGFGRVGRIRAPTGWPWPFEMGG